MQLEELKASLKDLSEADLRKLFLDMRSNRRTPKKATIERAEKAQKDGVITKASMKQTIKSLSAEDAAALLAQLTGGAI